MQEANKTSRAAPLASVIKTLLLIDLVDSTALIDRVGDERATVVFAEHDRVARDLLIRFGGREIDKTDGFLLLFDRPVDGVRYALAYHRALRNLSSRLDVPLSGRAALHLGEVFLHENSPEDVARGAKPLEVEGLPKHTVARVASLAQAGQTLLTRSVYDLARRAAVVEEASDRSIDWLEHGPYRFKGVEQPAEIFEVGVIGFAPLAVPPDSDKAHRDITDVPEWATSVIAAPGSDTSVVGVPGLATAPVTAPEAEHGSLAVLPFVNMSSVEENEYFSDGITEELIAQVSRIRGPKVISRTSVMCYKKSEKSLAAIARELSVATILEGSVRRAGSRVRIVAKLVDVGPDKAVWSETYDRDIKDIFAVQTDVTERIAAALETSLSATDKEKILEQGPENPETYTVYLKGRYYLNKLEPEGIKKGIQYFGRSLDLEPTYARAYAGLSTCYANAGHFGFLPIGEAFPKAKAAATQALELDSTLAEAHTSMAFVSLLYEWDWAAAEAGFRRAIELNPNDGEARVFYSWYLQAMNRLDGALGEAYEALRVDPLSIVAHTNLGHMLIISARYDEGIEQLRKTLDMAPDAAHPKYLIGAALVGKGQYEEAIQMLKDELLLHGKPVLAWAYALSGRTAESEALIEEISQPTQSRQGSTSIAMTYLLLGDEKQGAAWLEKAHADRDTQLMHVRSNPVLARFHSNAKLLEIYDRMGLPH